ncbi:4-(cytidine 5'-diphospho)-2-C-methyl-D-erythritol kinase [Sphingobium sp. Ant17]|uniref:4-(cytidine 5'-diphospho)-2-C-methyl-D-erythritol kinase n=1 Tax=Sphingobium sp. Ant17 TaxID=1461752 RepID=UPI0004498527|nr:4-(cytidine 5'-diphospho)-2-C-methyl-D-erythritol kinase [Sphingobium sp. Ant17]EXS71140.1 4-diphosphocytidyl-2C-methyl-D-erythritol kinase [Sphingobium sp. Ant17]OHC99567.1 MAG: 4-(cytidine 5'-diphospho)-2-C-methyl-D-erythritol kinase [Sphingomonadales bacterium GWF1_63_6]|tara:strand:+ start:30667 stop:31548 length:882 start_codon:yes stop_codon:yes gene_type:complete
MPHHDAELEADTLVETAYAKVNVALHVRARRDDGYHALESLFVFAEHGDRLIGRATDDGAIDLMIDGPFGGALDAGPGNLVMKAARALQSYLGEQRGAAIRLTKILPVASGIGGGSADAAATLRLLVRLWDVRIDDGELAALSLDLGSDVPACIASVTQLVTGRGEGLARHAVEGLAGMAMLLVNPGVAVPTGQVFAGWDRQDRGALDAGSLKALIEAGRNDLQASAIAVAPVIAQVLTCLETQSGLTLARMSGSGATCFALFEDDAALADAAMAVRIAYPDWWVMETRIGAA